MRVTYNELPQVLQTDRWTIEIYHQRKVVRFLRRRIRAGEIVTDKTPEFSLKKKDFDLYQDAWDVLTSALRKF